MSELQEVEKLINESKKAIERGLALDRLKKNKDFKELFIDFFIKEESVSLVKKKTDYRLDQDVVDQSIYAISYFSLFLDHIEITYQEAKDAIFAQEQEKLNILSEEEDI